MRLSDAAFEEDPRCLQRAADVAVLNALRMELGGPDAPASDASYSRSDTDLLAVLRTELDRYVDSEIRGESRFARTLLRLTRALQRAERLLVIDTGDVPAPASRPPAGSLAIRLPRELPGLVEIDIEPTPDLSAGWHPASGVIQLLQGKPVGTLLYRRHEDLATLEVAVWWNVASAELSARASRGTRSKPVSSAEGRRLERDARARTATIWSAFTEIGTQLAFDSVTKQTVLTHAGLHGADLR